MEEYDRGAWEELIDLIVCFVFVGCNRWEVCGWLSAKAELPVWAKMTTKITDITQMEKTHGMVECESLPVWAKMAPPPNIADILQCSSYLWCLI
ncbi:hypothetical protein MKW98_007240 [Papaver atlanticum]|uniref:Uncharacterized protein n=1 Tax=Papaver atlanticum TaxID=357466 RepID=A0AAD4XBA8_9MAGN|nr:hypothetical protein MKW98_007240 [Papaver atlanticum]